MAKQDVSALPTLDDFTEVDDLQGRPGFTQPKKDEPIVPAAGASADPKIKEAADKAKADADAAKKAEDDKAAAEAKKKTDEDKKKTTAKELTPEETEALIKKAEEKPETLSPEERKYLLDKKLFEETTNFWEDVEKEHGIKVEVDFGDVDPESPKGAALRDQALIDMAVAGQLEYLKNTFPDAYQILEHVSNGGKITDIIKPEETDFTKVTLDKDNKEAQKDLLLNFYKGKGFDAKRAQRMVEADEDSAEGLFAVAQDALKQLSTAQTERIKAVVEQQKAEKAEVEKRNTALKNTVKQITDSGKLGDFTILSPKDKADFYQFAVKNIYSDGGNGYQVVLPINEKSMIPVLQQLFFGFKEGKLDEFVKREAQTQQVKKLQRRVSQSSFKTGGQEGDGAAAAGQTKALPTFDIFKAD
jgi:hypothetical protein